MGATLHRLPQRTRPIAPKK